MPLSTNFVTFEQVAERFKDKSVAIIGSAPSCLTNPPGLIESHDIVVRVNNFKTEGFEQNVGKRTDVFYSFFGTSIKKPRAELIRDGVTLCMCKCPNSKPLKSEWHERNNKPLGVDFRYIYEARKPFWFCDTYIPTDAHFLEQVNALNGHIPSTGISCVMDLCSFECDIYVTGFDLFTSKVHNVDESWKPGRPDDPIGHSTQQEIAWLKRNSNRFTADKTLRDLLV